MVEGEGERVFDAEEEDGEGEVGAPVGGFEVRVEERDVGGEKEGRGGGEDGGVCGVRDVDEGWGGGHCCFGERGECRARKTNRRDGLDYRMESWGLDEIQERNRGLFNSRLLHV